MSSAAGAAAATGIGVKAGDASLFRVRVVVERALAGSFLVEFADGFQFRFEFQFLYIVGTSATGAADEARVDARKGAG